MVRDWRQMASAKKFRSVVHNIADHAISGLSDIHPHLAEHCRAVHVPRASIDLLTGTLAPGHESVSAPLGLAMTALSKTFSRICEREGIDVAALSDARLTCEFAQGDWPRWCHVRARKRDGKDVETAVDSLGRQAEVLQSERPGPHVTD